MLFDAIPCINKSRPEKNWNIVPYLWERFPTNLDCPPPPPPPRHSRTRHCNATTDGGRPVDQAEKFSNEPLVEVETRTKEITPLGSKLW